MPERPIATSTMVLAFDFGTRRIGVAVGETMIGQARALDTIEGESNELRFAAIARVIGEWQPTRLLVGLPLSVEGEAHEMTARCKRFANQLQGRFALPVILVDERYSSTEAETSLREAGIQTRTDKGRIDAQAARILLQSYFDGGDAVLIAHASKSA